MSLRRPLTAFGAGIAVFLGVTVALIELLSFEFSAILGLPIGLLAGGAVAVWILSNGDAVSGRIRLVATALAGFGYGVAAAFAANYVDLVDTQFETTLAAGVVAGALALALASVRDGTV